MIGVAQLMSLDAAYEWTKRVVFWAEWVGICYIAYLAAK